MSERVHKITSLGTDAPREAGSAESAGSGEPGVPRAFGVERSIDTVLAIQRPVVLAHLRGIRRKFPNATPEQIVRILERRYLTAVTTGGAAVGATAVIPGIGTGVTLALSGVETAGFLEATTLFAQSVAEVHGIAVESPERARALVMTLMLGREGIDLVRQLASQATGHGVARNAYWGELITNSLPKAFMGTVVDRLRGTFIKQFAVRGGAGIIGKAIPFGIGAAIGGTGNHLLGRKVLQQARLAFGAPPPVLPRELEPVERDSVVRSTANRVGRAGSAVGGFAVSTSRGLREVAGRATRRRRRLESGDEAPAGSVGFDEDPAADTESAANPADPLGDRRHPPT